MRTYRIGISCIGSGIGQAVVNSCRLSGLPLYTVGLGTNPFAYGAYDCDIMVKAPTIYVEDYVDRLIPLLKEQRIDLLIPGHDDEALFLSRTTDQFNDAGIKVITAGTKLIELCRDKQRMSNDLNPAVNVFVKSYDKAGAIEAIEKGEIDYPLIAKPRGGFASKGIQIILNKADAEHINESHIVQQFAIPHEEDPNYQQVMDQLARRINPQLSEVSIQLVTGTKGEMMARMASFNKLNNGVPIEVLPFENKAVWDAVDRLYPVLHELGLCGPFNIQGRLTNKGFKIFEMNPRFTGITGLRAVMGFNEVEACIKKWLDLPAPETSLAINHNTFGVRQTADKAVPVQRQQQVARVSERINTTRLRSTLSVLVTGASGYLGRNLIRELLSYPGYEVYALTTTQATIEELLGDPARCFSINDLREGHMSLGQIDRLVHCAFGRPHREPEQIADSLAFTRDLFTRALMQQVPAVINISSQAVYGLGRDPLWSEDLPAAPQTPYAQAKYATELMGQSMQSINAQTRFASLRMGTLSGGLPGFLPIGLLAKFAIKAMKGEPITIVGGTQSIDRLDLRDAIRAIKALLKVDPMDWEAVYNVGSDKQYGICDLAEKTAQATAALTGCEPSQIIVKDQDVDMRFGMDITRMQDLVGWSPQYSIDDTIRSVVEYMREYS